MYRVLINDQYIDSLREEIQSLITFGFECFIGFDQTESMHLLVHKNPHIVILHFNSISPDNYTFIKNIKSHSPNIPVIVISEEYNIDTIVQSIKSGADEFFSKKEMKMSLIKLIEKYLFENPDFAQISESKITPDKDSMGIIGNSKEAMELYNQIIKIAKVNSNVFLIGESGTGKELVAKNIHLSSSRRNKPFIPLDCSALPSNLLESELFGYEKGAFTGALKSKPGVIELANSGTLFLDEITELDLSLQSKLLRFIQERHFRKVGGKDLIHVDVRIISATNKDPQQLVKENLLRQDLYYRINVIPIVIPPLRKRPDDISLLIEHFIKLNSITLNKNINSIAPETMAKLLNYNWPGNIRELQNVVEHMMTMSDKTTLDNYDLPNQIKAYKNSNQGGKFFITNYKDAKQKHLEKFINIYFSDLISKYGGNISKISMIAGLSRKQLYNIFREHNINYKIEKSS